MFFCFLCDDNDMVFRFQIGWHSQFTGSGTLRLFGIPVLTVWVVSVKLERGFSANQTKSSLRLLQRGRIPAGIHCTPEWNVGWILIGLFCVCVFFFLIPDLSSLIVLSLCLNISVFSSPFGLTWILYREHSHSFLSLCQTLNPCKVYLPGLQLQWELQTFLCSLQKVVVQRHHLSLTAQHLTLHRLFPAHHNRNNDYYFSPPCGEIWEFSLLDGFISVPQRLLQNSSFISSITSRMMLLKVKKTK